MRAKQALQETILIWDSLSKSGSSEKEDAIEETDLFHITEYAGMCPLCEHCSHVCKHCLVWGDRGYHCLETYTGEYNLWKYGPAEERNFRAKKIADMAREALDKLETTE